MFVIHPELYRLQTPASPHIAARIDKTEIDIDKIRKRHGCHPAFHGAQLVIEGAGGLLVPLTGSLHGRRSH
jgi:dethiobiotin synthetase